MILYLRAELYIKIFVIEKLNELNIIIVFFFTITLNKYAI